MGSARWLSHEAAAAAAAARGQDTLALRVSSPTLLLNHVAQRYPDTARIVMEYVDNALDDAEDSFDAQTNAYRRAVHVRLVVDRKGREVRVVDNGRGMSSDQLVRIVQNVGESTKRGQPFLNGQFGFGVHAFRAAAHSLTVRTCQRAEDGVLEMTVGRDQSDDIARPVTSPTPLPTPSGTGTEVMVAGFDKAWQSTLQAPKIAHEISLHFDRLLTRGNLRITVVDANTQTAHECVPFDYGGVEGLEISEHLPVDKEQSVEVYLKVVKGGDGSRPVCVFSKGRRIKELGHLQSFMRTSRFRKYIWSHPSLIGFIEVGSVLEPVITRDEFKRTVARHNMYEQLASKLEPRLKRLVDETNAATYVQSMGQLQETIGKCLAETLRSAKRRARKQELQTTEIPFTRARPLPADPLEGEEPEEHRAEAPEAKAEAKPERKPERKPEPKPEEPKPEAKKPESEPEPKSRLGELPIQFANSLRNSEGVAVRSLMVGNSIVINTHHADFVERCGFSRSGKPLFSERLCSYLAYIVAITHTQHELALRVGPPPSVDEAATQFVDIATDLEDRLRKHIKQEVVVE